MSDFKGENSDRITVGLQLGIGVLLLGYGIARSLGIATYKVPWYGYVIIGACLFIWGVAKSTSS